jgi:hypothetical protein
MHTVKKYFSSDKCHLETDVQHLPWRLQPRHSLSQDEPACHKTRSIGEDSPQKFKKLSFNEYAVKMECFK